MRTIAALTCECGRDSAPGLLPPMSAEASLVCAVWVGAVAGDAGA